MKPKKLKLKEILHLYSKIKHLINNKQDLDDLIVSIRLDGLGEEVYWMFYSEKIPEDDLEFHTYLSIAFEDNNFGAFLFFILEITNGR